MSPARIETRTTPSVESALRRVRGEVARQIRDARLARRWSVDDLARRAGVSRWAVYGVERTESASLEVLVRLADALHQRLELELVDARRKDPPSPRAADPVHAAMGEFELRHLRMPARGLSLDEPYQHFQFAGRADVLSWNLDERALLHIENRTRFPNLQEMAGSFNAKRAYLGKIVADRMGLHGSWRSETHVIAALWSAEVLHQLRLRRASFEALCPDDATAFETWWRGGSVLAGRHSTLVVLDPLASGRQRAFVPLTAVLTARPRYHGYADAASAILASRG